MGFHANLVPDRLAPVAIGVDLHFDELMCGQRAVDLGDDPIGEPRLADVDARLQRVRTSFEVLPFARRQ